MKLLLSALMLLTLFSACNNPTPAGRVSSEDSALNVVRTSFIDKKGMDSTVQPGDDFYNYANGNWIKATVIPADQAGWGSFTTLYEDNLKRLKLLVEDAKKSNAAKGSLEQKTADYYASGMDTFAIEKAGINPLKQMLARIDTIKDYRSMMNVIAENNVAGRGELMGFFTGSDEKNSAKYIAVFSQSGLSLPEKGYYSRTDSATNAARIALVKYAAGLFRLAGADTLNANRQAADVLKLETEISKSHRTPEEQRDPEKNYNKKAVADLQMQQPNVNWQNFFTKMKVFADSVDVQQPDYFIALNKLLASQPIEIWKTKMKFDLLSHYADNLSQDFRNTRFEFTRTFSGQKEQKPRWKTLINFTDEGLGELLGQLYVKKYFTEKAKARMDELVTNLTTAFEARMNKYEWMTDSTKQRALTKLHAFIRKIGYPSRWKSYDDVSISSSDFFANSLSIEMHAKKESIQKIGRDVDKTEWGMTPPTVNAYYNPSFNEIVFPAGILQFPFFDENADDAINYGGIGMVIGHEMTHGFDDQGSQYDETGNMRNWWTKDDLKNFKVKTGAVAKQYNSYKLFDIPVNGNLTLGENLADIGGIAIAYDAFKLTPQGKGSAMIDGYTPDQRFFLGFAQAWRSVYRDEIMRVLLKTDPHSPDRYRVLGPLSNFDPFYAAFNVKEGNKMWVKPADRTKVW